jgi:geranylgeranyl reductase family protein
MHDVVVVGGGPGGLYTAALLGRAGFDVVLLEEHAITGHPVHCTGVLAAEAFAEFDVPRESVLNPLSTARFFSPSGLTISHTTLTTEALVVDRAVFDQGLYTRALDAGVDVRLGVRVTGVSVRPDGVEAATVTGGVCARALVLACGANYSLHRRLGLGMPAAFLRSAQLEMRADRLGDVEIHFGSDVAPEGFAWMVPVQRGDTRCARIGLMCSGDAGAHFQRFLARTGPVWGLDHQLPPRLKMLPLAPIDRTYADRVLAVGDAAGLVKATTGGGIYYSLVSASMAAETLTSGLGRDTLSAPALSRYERRWQRRLGAELDAQFSLRELAGRLGDDDIDALFDLAQTNGVMPIVRRTARFNQHRELIVSILKHAPARRLLVKELASRTAAFALR